MARTYLLTGEDAEIVSMQEREDTHDLKNFSPKGLSTYPCANYRKPIGILTIGLRPQVAVP